ncbi:MAG TPA: TIR domain-containing protein [Thermoanaerobaculia bacterium]|nr:TIR domain-containing protein [Thermoanaerobaculia bacterium]
MARKVNRAGEVPGLRLRYRLEGHGKWIDRIAWSPDGRILATPSADRTVRLWDPAGAESLAILKRHTDEVNCVAWSPDSTLLVSGGDDSRVVLWNAHKRNAVRSSTPRRDSFVVDLGWSPDGSLIAAALGYDGLAILKRSNNQWLTPDLLGCFKVAWSPDGRFLAVAAATEVLVLRSGTWTPKLSIKEDASFVCWSPKGDLLVTLPAGRGPITFWDAATGRRLRELEGHISEVRSVHFSADGKLLASKSERSVHIWRCDTFETSAVVMEYGADLGFSSLAFHPLAPVLATLDDDDTAVRIWDLDYDLLFGKPPKTDSIHYTTAKVALVGNSGVGKTGLGWRLAHGQFKEHESTHGQQFWVIPELGITRADGVECEAVLWDLAGQPDYRLIHTLFLDDVDLALLLFDASNREDPLQGVEYWLKHLAHAAKERSVAILVGARIDRGTPSLTGAEIAAFCSAKGIDGGYVLTSAARGQGIKELMERIKAHVRWDALTATVTTSTFKRIKEHVLALKESAGKKGVLVSLTGLARRMRKLDPGLRFTPAEVAEAVRHLAKHGYVTLLRSSSAKLTVLLSPDLLVNLAASCVLEARRHPRDLGTLDEERLLRRGYAFPELAGLKKGEQELLLDATAMLFLEHNLCFREAFNNQTILVFPSLINEKRPRIEEADLLDDVSYRVSGAVEKVYATLVVLLGYTNSFTRTNQWQNQAQYLLGPGEICGFRQIAEREGEIELVLYYSRSTPDEVKALFQGMLERFLKRRDVAIVRILPVRCGGCGKVQERSSVESQLRDGLDYLFCRKCGRRLAIPGEDAIKSLPAAAQEEVKREEQVAERRTAFAAALVGVKGLRRRLEKDAANPSCFISYAWGTSQHERWVSTVAEDLRDAGVEVILDRWHNPPGSSISRFIERIDSAEFVLAIGTPGYRTKYDTIDADPVVEAELRLINTRLRRRSRRAGVLPLLLAGDLKTSYPPLFEDSVLLDFREEDAYFVALFDLLLTLYQIPFDTPGLSDLRNTIIPESESLKARKR